jgi:hypothetical protein
MVVVCRIMGAVAGLGDNEELVIVNIFDPVPLYGVLGQRGFSHETARTPAGDWCITFRGTPNAGDPRELTRFCDFVASGVAAL